MERRRSTTLQSLVRTSFTGISTSCGTARSSTRPNYFTNATPGNHKPRSTVNHFGGSVGGPIIRDKLFFFFDSEWVRIALPIVTATTVPTPAFQNYVLQQLPLGGTDSVTGSVYQPSPQSVPFYQKMFSLYGNTSGTPLAVLGCPFDVGRSCARDCE